MSFVQDSDSKIYCSDSINRYSSISLSVVINKYNCCRNFYRNNYDNYWLVFVWARYLLIISNQQIQVD